MARRRSATQHEESKSTGKLHEFDPPPQEQTDAAIISRRAADRLRGGHVWVYRSDISSLPENPANLLAIRDQRGVLLGTALYSPSSEITLRLIAREELASEADWLQILQERLHAALALRSDLLASTENNACRLVFSEADALPGLIADKYGDLIVLQLLTKGLDNEAVRIVATSVLKAALHPSVIVERPDARIRELEQLSVPLDAAPLYIREDEISDDLNLQTQFLLNGLKFHYDAAAGQKTGAFLDQRENYAAAARYAHGEALDVCTYQGGFALHLARAAPALPESTSPAPRSK